MGLCHPCTPISMGPLFLHQGWDTINTAKGVRLLLMALATISMLVACRNLESSPAAEPAIPVRPQVPSLAPVPATPEIRPTYPIREAEQVGELDLEVDRTEFLLGPIMAETLRETSLFREMRFSSHLAIVGGSSEASSIEVESSLNGERPQTIHLIEGAAPREEIEVSTVLRLGPGDHRIEFSVGDAVALSEIVVESPDVSAEILSYRPIDPKSIALRVAVANQGTAPASGVQIWGWWEPFPQEYALLNLISGSVGELAVGDTKAIDIPVIIPPGSFTFQITASADTLDVDTENNIHKRDFEIGFDQIRVQLLGSHSTTYQRPETVIGVTLLVENVGVYPAGEVQVGAVPRSALADPDRIPADLAVLPRCAGEFGPQCWWDIGTVNLPAGAASTVHASLPIGEGDHSLVIFAAGPDFRDRSTGSNILDINLKVDRQPEFDIQARIDADVLGYWSDGTANLQVTSLVWNAGSSALAAPQQIEIGCHAGPLNSIDCSREFEISLADGFGPSQHEFIVRVPMGELLELKLSVPGTTIQTIESRVPTRVIGFDRYVWDCYRARSGSSLSASPYQIGCGGWTADRVDKWPVGQSVGVWSTGRPEYIRVFNEVLARFSPIVNLQFHPVSGPLQADFTAYLGLPPSAAAEFNLSACADYGGCTLALTDQVTGVAHSATIVAWHFDWAAEPEQFIKAVAHEVLHAIVTVGHRPTPDALMGEPVSPGDLEIIRLNSHPLIQPGMNMAQVRELIVLNDKLLDPPSPSAYELLWQTAEGFQRAGSAQFKVSGTWSGTCGFASFGPAKYEVVGYSHADSRFARFESAGQIIWNSGERYWIGRGAELVPISGDDVLREFGWIDSLSDPMSLLHAAVAYGGRETFRIAERDDSTIVFVAAGTEVPDEWTPITDVVLTADAKSMRLSEFQMTRALFDTCKLQIHATDVNYGNTIDIPGVVAGA